MVFPAHNYYLAQDVTDVFTMPRHQVLPMGLKESISKVRASVAYALSSIAHWDWPEEWPELFDILMACLKSGDEHAVHGAMRVLTEFSRDLTDVHVSQVAPVLLAECYRIFVESNVSVYYSGKK